MPSGRVVFLRLLVGELGTLKLAKIFAYGKWLYQYRMQLHGASDLDQRCLKTRRSAVVISFCVNYVHCDAVNCAAEAARLAACIEEL